MLFGDSAFSELPFATDSVGTRAEIVVGANALTMAIGVFAISASTIIEDATATPMTLSSAFASIITNVNINSYSYTNGYDFYFSYGFRCS